MRSVLKVADVPIANDALSEMPSSEAIDVLIGSPAAPPTTTSPPAFEACSHASTRLVRGVAFHPGVAAAHLAFKDHRRLVLSPDIVWMLLAQGFAQHVNANAEDLRPQFVSHVGRLALSVRRDDLVKGSAENPWAEVVNELSAQIRDHIGPGTHTLLEPTFSTTRATDRAAAQIVLLDAMQSYFEYEVMTLCGIPEVVLEGTPADWQSIAERAQAFARFGLEWWTEPLTMILEEFVAASRGRVRARFWQSLYKADSVSGGPYVSGWLMALFPYLRSGETSHAMEKNRWLAAGGKALDEIFYPAHDSRPFGRPTSKAFPSGLARAPFQWRYLGRSYEMEFVAGFVGVRQERENMSVRPEIGWVVYDRAQRESVLAARTQERLTEAAAADRRAHERAQRWTRRGMCPRCQFWRYLDATDVAVCCGVPLVRLEQRERDGAASTRGAAD
jgi:hypothetical protein